MDVEIKVNFTGSQIERAKQVFELDRESKERKIWFAEIVTGRDGRGALPLLGRGVILRVRTKKSNAGDVTLKLRGPDGGVDEVAWGKRVAGLPDAKIEGDWADRRLVSASLSADFGKPEREKLDAGTASLDDLMSGAQKALSHELLVPHDATRLLGPIKARKWDPDGGIAAEQWTVGDLEFLEISVVTSDDPDAARRKLQEQATEGGLELEEGQEPKTTRVLRFLAGAPG